MFLGELFVVFCFFVCLTYTSTQNGILAIHGLFSATIGFYLALIITTLALKNDIDNAMQIFFIFFIVFATITILIKYGLQKLIHKDKNNRNQPAQPNKFKHLLLAAKYTVASLLSSTICLINLSFIVNVAPFFVVSHSGTFTQYIVNNNILNLFKEYNLNYGRQAEEGDITDKALIQASKTFNLNNLQTQDLVKAYNSLSKNTQHNLQNAFYVNQNYKHFLLDVLSKYIDKYPLLSSADAIDLGKIDDIRNTILYGPDYLKLHQNKDDNDDKNENSYENEDKNTNEKNAKTNKNANVNDSKNSTSQNHQEDKHIIINNNNDDDTEDDSISKILELTNNNQDKNNKDEDGDEDSVITQIINNN